MYISITTRPIDGSSSVTTQYEAISEISFSPQVDLTGDTLPINELWVTVLTDDQIPIGSDIRLYDDSDGLWASYRVTYSESEEHSHRRVRGQSLVFLLDGESLEPKMYENETFQSCVSETCPYFFPQIDNTLANRYINGYLPKQTRRQRLQWLCMACSAYLIDAFNDGIRILPIEDVETKLVPMELTYWKPKVTYNDYVTAVEVTAYNYTHAAAGEISRTQDYVKVNVAGTDHYYIQTTTELTETNPEFPVSMPDNIITIDKMTLLSTQNADDVLGRMARFHFQRMEVTFDVINNAQFFPGDYLAVYNGDGEMLTGYVESCSFKFGTQASSTIKLTAAENIPYGELRIDYEWGGTQVGRRVFRLPVGYEYEVSVQYIDNSFSGHRYVFRPMVGSVSGTMTEEGATHEVEVEVALDYYNGDLYVRSVDLATVVANNDWKSLVIS